ncbi:hypothetical protein SAMN04487857_13210 [Pseudomonas sp. ok272]|uniref:hypothetical protein n=1 Tax=unclassified Pseudomonas TaxID=196821 RepID=UPI0008D6083C|nr:MULTISPECIES: hypothetical protein [unclassified Pseudomonas]SEN65863.1 hypothetical protein SAMN04487857_13210 [Pseudomonas sp. ok272]SFN46154.1 hypothetical protein SAMN04487858_13410 [Pseudomonas sp. ok602]
MGWDRQAPEVVDAPESLQVGRWVLAAGMALLAGVLLFLLHASERVPLLQMLNIWAVCSVPVLIWVLLFATRAYVYGGALNDYQFLEDEAKNAQQSWQDWAQRFVAVHASCVLLPDQVSASALVQGTPDLPPRMGQVRRIATLPMQAQARAVTGLRLLFPALEPALKALPTDQELRVTVLSDIDPAQYDALRDAWQLAWGAAIRRPPPTLFSVVDELSYQWIDDTLKTASTAVELILVLQVQGEAEYSDALAALLLSPDRLAFESALAMKGRLLRPMPLDIDALNSELPLFLQTQASARLAVGLLADREDWQPLAGQVFSAVGAHGGALQVEQRWNQECLCGLPGPFSHWVVAALGAEMALHRQQPLLVLSQNGARHWINTVTTGEWV